jgi:uncharacterized protein
MSTSPLPRELDARAALQLDITDSALVIAGCNACGHRFRFALALCPKCHSDEVISVEASGVGTLFTYSTSQPSGRAGAPGGISAVVQLAEGPKILSSIVECDTSDLRVGMSLKVARRTSPDPLAVPAFTIA